MIGGSHPPAAQSLTAFLFRFFGSTGVKMFLILTLALLPLGLIALVASLQAIETADLEKEALLRVAVSQSARKLTADLNADRTALGLTVNALAVALFEQVSRRECLGFQAPFLVSTKESLRRAAGVLLSGRALPVNSMMALRLALE